MSLTGSILEFLPDYVPKSDIKIDEREEFKVRDSGTPKTVYKIKQGPVKRLDEVIATVSGTTQSLEIDEEVEIRDTTGDAQYDSIAFIDSDVLPDDGTEFQATYVAEPLLSRYVGSFDEDIKKLGDKIDDSIDGKYLDTAEGRELDRIGAQYGPIGRRLGREDNEYRSFLRSIVETFDATGTKSGIRFVTGAVLEVDPDLVEIIEDFDNQEFRVRVEHPDSQVQTTSLNSLIDLSSPTGVGVSGPPTLYLERNIGITSKTPTVFDSNPSISLNYKIPTFLNSTNSLSFSTDIVDLDRKIRLGFEFTGFEAIESSLGLGSSTINSDRTLGSQLTTFSSSTEIGLENTGSVITDSSEGLSSSTLDSGDTYE